MPIDLRGPDAVLAALTSADLIVPPVAAAAGPPGLAWLRARVPRFSSGAEHGRHRAATTAALAGLELKALRDNAFRRTRDALVGRGEVELMAEVARRVPVAVLAEALALPVDGSDVAAVARVYLTGPDDDPSVDAAVARLVAATGRPDGAAAVLVGILVQAYEATAGLIGNAALAALRAAGPDTAGGDATGSDAAGGEDAVAVVDRTLHEDPPILATRRLATVDTTIDGVHIGAGDIVRIDLASAGRTLGAGPHACPGAAEARAITAGVLQAVRGWHRSEEVVVYLVSQNLRVPARLILTR